MVARMAMDTAAHVDNPGVSIGSRSAGTGGVHHGQIVVASTAIYPAIIALAADFVGIRAAEHVSVAPTGR